ncbi:YciI family protein [Flavobacterium sp. '19STA2R22 D10 B1']|uniref:YciI family protein n=1 Tax=Flavobacterium aerium TaxID=3037261 RepID=UPI00278C4410|nr:YciI family protein [Flavobacterium sp. '19STA2R22 D10 B1']
MKRIILIAILGLFYHTMQAQAENPKYNKNLAESLGADEYGMKFYVLVILKTGANTTKNKEVTDSLFQGHMANIEKLAKDGKLVIAGPMQKNEKSYRGIFVLNVKTIEEAATLLETDPAIKEKLLEAELYGWYGSAALPLYLKEHDKIEKKKH